MDGVANLTTIPPVKCSARLQSQKHPDASCEDASLPTQPFSSRQINGVVVTMYCSSVQSSLPRRRKIGGIAKLVKVSFLMYKVLEPARTLLEMVGITALLHEHRCIASLSCRTSVVEVRRLQIQCLQQVGIDRNERVTRSVALSYKVARRVSQGLVYRLSFSLSESSTI